MRPNPRQQHGWHYHAGDIYPALERGAIDAAEYIGPHDDEKLGFKNVAKYCYTPGRQEGGTLLHVIASLEKWESLPPAYKKAVVVTAQATTTSMLGHWTPRTPTPCFGSPLV